MVFPNSGPPSVLVFPKNCPAKQVLCTIRLKNSSARNVTQSLRPSNPTSEMAWSSRHFVRPSRSTSFNPNNECLHSQHFTAPRDTANDWDPTQLLPTTVESSSSHFDINAAMVPSGHQDEGPGPTLPSENSDFSEANYFPNFLPAAYTVKALTILSRLLTDAFTNARVRSRRWQSQLLHSPQLQDPPPRKADQRSIMHPRQF
jgi:hypothetical protein